MFRPADDPGRRAGGGRGGAGGLAAVAGHRNASGVAPEVGLVTAVVGGMVAALLGGCRLQVSGPAAAMTFLVCEVVTKYGMAGLIAATLMAGLFQVLAGVFRLGRFMQYIPRPVIAGFLSGIGLTILCTQLPVILGYEVLARTRRAGRVALLWKTLRQIDQTELSVAGRRADGDGADVRPAADLAEAPHAAPGRGGGEPAAARVLGWTQVACWGPCPSEFPAPEPAGHPLGRVERAGHGRA